MPALKTPHSLKPKPVVMLQGEEAPDRIIGLCVRALAKTGLPDAGIEEFLETANEAEDLEELARAIDPYCTLRDR